MKFFGVKELTLGNFDFNQRFKNAFKDHNGMHAADPEIRLPKKSILQPFGLPSRMRQRGS